MGYTPCFSNPHQYIVVLIVRIFIHLLVRSPQNEKPAYGFCPFFLYILIREKRHLHKALYPWWIPRLLFLLVVVIFFHIEIHRIREGEMLITKKRELDKPSRERFWWRPLLVRHESWTSIKRDFGGVMRERIIWSLGGTIYRNLTQGQVKTNYAIKMCR